MQSLSASFEPLQLLAGGVTHEVGLLGGWQFLATQAGEEVTGPRVTEVREMSRLILLDMGVSHCPENLQSPCLAYTITMPIIIIMVVAGE